MLNTQIAYRWSQTLIYLHLYLHFYLRLWAFVCHIAGSKWMCSHKQNSSCTTWQYTCSNRGFKARGRQLVCIRFVCVPPGSRFAFSLNFHTQSPFIAQATKLVALIVERKTSGPEVRAIRASPMLLTARLSYWRFRIIIGEILWSVSRTGKQDLPRCFAMLTDRHTEAHWALSGLGWKVLR